MDIEVVKVNVRTQKDDLKVAMTATATVDQVWNSK